MKKVILYLRVSTTEQAKEGYSLKAQEAALKKYAEAMDYDIIDILTDDGFSGKDLARPGVQKLLNYVKMNYVDVVLIYKLDRLSRKVRNMTELIDLFNEKSVILYSLSEQIDLTSPFGRASVQIGATFAELERENIRDRMVMGKLQKVSEGYWLRKKNLPIGYDWDDEQKKLVPNNEAEQILKIFELYNKGFSISQTSAYMNKNYTNRYKSYAWRTAATKTLRNPIYSGHFVFSGKIYKAKNIEPIMTYEYWLESERRRLKSKATYTNAFSPYLLSGILKCGCCGKSFVSKKYSYANRNTRYSYGCWDRVKHEKRNADPCNNKIYSQKELDELVVRTIKNIKIVNYLAEENKISEFYLAKAELEKKNSKLVDLYLEDLINKGEFEKRKFDIDSKLDNLEKIKTQNATEERVYVKIDIDKLNYNIMHFDELELSEKRLTLMALFKDITISYDNIIFNWRVSYKSI